MELERVHAHHVTHELGHINKIQILPIYFEKKPTLENVLGPDEWILLRKDKRTKFLTSPENIDILPHHSYVYRNESDTESQVVIVQ